MTVGELFNILKQYKIPNDAVLMSDSGWEGWATDIEGIYYNRAANTIVFTQDVSDLDLYYWSNEWVALKGDN